MNTTNKLRIFFAAEILTPLLLAIVFETGLGEMDSHLVDEPLVTYLMQMAGIVLTICAIPFALKIMKFAYVKRRIQTSELEYCRWSIIRIAILGVPLIFNTLAYYLLEFDLLAVILLSLFSLHSVSYGPLTVVCARNANSFMIRKRHETQRRHCQL